jgi:hypothetical protein
MRGRELNLSASGLGTVVGCCEHGGETSGYFFISLRTVSFSRMAELHGVSCVACSP